MAGVVGSRWWRTQSVHAFSEHGIFKVPGRDIVSKVVHCYDDCRNRKVAAASECTFHVHLGCKGMYWGGQI